MTDDSDSIDQSISSMTSSWLGSAKAGDAEAWRRLVRVYGNLICWWCRQGGIPAQDVDDVAQEVLAAVSRALSDFDHHSFRGFLWSVTSHKIKDYWRARHRQPQLQGGANIDELLKNVEAETHQPRGAVDTATRIVFEAVVQLVRGEFCERDWQVFWEYAVERRDAAAVAEAHGVTRNQVFLAKSRILRRIRSEFGDY